MPLASAPLSVCPSSKIFPPPATGDLEVVSCPGQC